MTDARTKLFGGYGFAIRTFWIKGTGLTVSRRWKRQETIDPDPGDRFSTSISGKAISEKDSVCVIGQENREIKEFALTIKSDAYATQEWERIRSIEELVIKNDGTTPELRVRAHIFEQLSKDPPTATLFVTDDDWETGIKGGWSIECAIPPSVLAQLEADLLAQRAHELHMGIKWEGALVRDEHAPPSFPTSWGLFTIAKNPEPLHGHVKSISWRVSNEPVALDRPIGQEQQQTPRRNIEEEVDRLGKTLAGHMLALTRSCVIGFFAALALILVGYFLR